MNNPKTQAIDGTEASKYAEILSFEPAEKVRFAVSRAKELLVKRTEEQCITIAEAISPMRSIINYHQSQRAMAEIKDKNLEQVWLLEGRSLSLWMDIFDISGMGVEKLEWYEVFAVNVLMHCLSYSQVASMTFREFGLSIDSHQFELLKLHAESKILDIVDCITRAEMLEKHGQIHSSAKLLGSKGGKGRAFKLAPLECEVISLYSTKEYENMPILKAANCIAVIIKGSKPYLLELTKTINKCVAIQNIIRKFIVRKNKIINENLSNS
ncbi:MAG: hypothetical protein J0M08_14205 [Bacteroidetes bacterium]|nr:hypothetical protein [Bacteroidota bacterium]